MSETQVGSHAQLVLFHVPDREAAERLVAGIGAEVDAWVRHEPGFLSSTFHISRDGLRVMNYARWRTVGDAFGRQARQSGIRDRIDAVGARAAESGGSFTVARSFVAGDRG